MRNATGKLGLHLSHGERSPAVARRAKAGGRGVMAFREFVTPHPTLSQWEREFRRIRRTAEVKTDTNDGSFPSEIAIAMRRL